LPRDRGRGSFAAWLFGIARRKCADYHRGKYGRPVDRLETTSPLPDPEAVDLEQQAYLNSVLDCVQQALVHLNPQRREALHLRFWGGLSVRETAAAMRRTPGAVKMLVSRAVADLKERCVSHE
jgi:RNA polymerase sigma-70 factor (ECF subfamily)